MRLGSSTPPPKIASCVSKQILIRGTAKQDQEKYQRNQQLHLSHPHHFYSHYLLRFSTEKKITPDENSQKARDFDMGLIDQIRVLLKKVFGCVLDQGIYKFGVGGFGFFFPPLNEVENSNSLQKFDNRKIQCRHMYIYR